MKPSLCIQDISVKGANVKLTEVTAKPQPKTKQETTGSISLPIPLFFDRVDLSDISVNVYGNKISLARLKTQGSWQGNQLTIDPSKISGLVVAPDQSTQPASSKSQHAQPSKKPSSKVSSITLPQVTLPLDIKLKRLEVDGFTLKQPQPFVINKFVFEGRGQGHNIDVGYLSVASPDFDGEMKGQVSLQGDYPLASDLKATINQTNFSGQKIALSLAGSIGNLEINSQLSGPIEGKLSGSMHPLVSNVPFDLTLESANSQWPLQGKSDYQFAVAKLKMKGDLDKYGFSLDGNVTGQQIPGTVLKTTGSGSINGIEFQQLNADTLGGTLVGNVKLDWQTLFSWQADLNLTNIQPNKQWPEVQGDLSGRIETNGSTTEQGGWQLNLPNVAVNGSIQKQPFRLDGSVSVSDSHGKGEYIVNTPNLVLAHGPNSITAQGELGEQWNMQLAVKLPKLSETLPGLGGQINGTVRVTDSLAKPKVALKLKAVNLDWQNNLTIKQAALDGTVAPLSDYQSNLVLSGEQIDYNHQEVNSVKAALKGTLNQHFLKLNVGSQRVSTQLSLQGNFKPSESWSGELETMSVRSRVGVWQLNKPTDIAYLFSQQQASVSPHCWVNGNSSICLDSKAIVGKSGKVALSVNDLSLHQVAGFLPKGIDFKGVANAKADMKWAPNEPPKLSVSLSIPDGEVIRQLPKPVTIAWSSIGLDASLKNNQLSSKWSVNLKQNGDISGHLDIPDVRQKNKLVDGALKVSQLNLNFLAPLIGSYSKLGANINSDLALKGAIKHPEIYGTATAEQIVVKGDISPVDVDSGKVSIKFDGKQSTLVGAIQTPEGKVNLTGDANWSSLQDWQANAHVSATGLLVNATSMAKLKVVPDLTIRVTPKLADIKGNIALPWGKS